MRSSLWHAVLVLEKDNKRQKLFGFLADSQVLTEVQERLRCRYGSTVAKDARTKPFILNASGKMFRINTKTHNVLLLRQLLK